MQKDIAQLAAIRLQGGWSAADFSKHLNKDSLRELLPKFEKFEPLVRVRILLSLLTLDNEAKRTLRGELQEFLLAAREDKEEWVSVTAKALGDLRMPLDFQAMLSGTAIVRDTVKDLEARLNDGDTSAFRPLEESYLSTRIVEEARGGPEPAITHNHFVPREGANGLVPGLSQRAKTSAASALASHPTGSAVSSPLHSSFHAVRHTEGAEAGRSPGTQPAGISEAHSRQPGMDEIFRTNRQHSLASSSRHLPAASGGQERRGAARPVSVKLLDVSEVQKLNESESRKKLGQAMSPDSSQVQGPNPTGQSMETEDGELEAGELCANSFPQHAVKRMRVAHEAVV